MKESFKIPRNNESYTSLVFSTISVELMNYKQS